WADQIAHSEVRNADSAVDRRTDLRVAEIDLCLFEQSLSLHDVGMCGLCVSGALIHLGLGNILIAHELLAALQLQIGVDFCRFCLGEVGGLLVNSRLVGVGFNAKQQIAGFDLLPFGEVALVDETRDSSDNVNLINCHHAADEISRRSYLATSDWRDGDRGRWTALGYRGLANRQ